MATASIDAISTSKLKDLLQCSICLETVTEPRTLPCFHSYCNICLERFVLNQRKKGQELKCANCRTKFTLSTGGVKGMKENHFILSMLDLMAIQNQIPCIPCGHNCDEPAVGRCVKCEKFLCKACLEDHNKYKGFRDHLVLSLGELSKPENKEKIKGTPLCGKHKGEELKLYCEKCEEIICRDCKDSGGHPWPEHNCLLLETVVEKKKDSLSTDIKTLDQMLTNGNKTLQELNKHLQTLEDDMKATEQGFDNTRKKILSKIEQTLNKKSQQFINDARKTYNKNKKETHEEIERIKSYLHKVSGTAGMSKNVLENGNKSAIVSTQNDIKKNVQTLQNENLKYEFGTQKKEVYNFNEIEAILIQEIAMELQYDVRGTSGRQEMSNKIPKSNWSLSNIKPFFSELKKSCFTVYLYRDDYKAIQKMVQYYPNIETGGDLFGLWQDDETVVIQLCTGPGERCRRTAASFYQDIEYLAKVGSVITKEEGLCNVGEWHSHHQNGMPGPSGGDNRTVLSNLQQLGLRRFVLFIASIKRSSGKRSRDIQLNDIQLNCFMFKEGLRDDQQPIHGEMVIIDGDNPFKKNNKVAHIIKVGAEPVPKSNDLSSLQETAYPMLI